MSARMTLVAPRHGKRCTSGQKLETRREWEITGTVVAVAENHGIHSMPLYRWGKRLETGAAEFLKGLDTFVFRPDTCEQGRCPD